MRRAWVICGPRSNKELLEERGCESVSTVYMLVSVTVKKRSSLTDPAANHACDFEGEHQMVTPERLPEGSEICSAPGRVVR